MQIDSYSFGVMKVDGTVYRDDLIIFPGRVKSGLWRKEGHSLAIEDLDDVLSFKPEVLVIGKGASGLMEVPASTVKLLQQQSIEVVAENTIQACNIYNEQVEKGKKVVGAFHLTC